MATTLLNSYPLAVVERIPVFKPSLEEAEIKAAVAALEMGWLGMGSYVGEFETAIKQRVGAIDRYVAAVSTGHAALHIGLLLAGVGPGDEVITPSFNNIADFQAILATGADPVFCDVLEDTLCIDVVKAEPLIGLRTKAIIVMDYDCHVCDHDVVAELATRHGLRVIHDAAHSFGSTYKGRPIGSFSDIAMFSFDPVKTITAIDGGALVVRTEEELNQIHEIRLIGMGQKAVEMYKDKRAWTYDVRRLGFRYHLANLHAAIGLAQLEKFDWIAKTRRRAFQYFNDKLHGIDGLILPRTDIDSVVPFMYYVRVLGGRRDEFCEHLQTRGIDTGIHWQPGHWFSLFKDCRRGDLSVTECVGREVVTLPFHSGMDEKTLHRVAFTVRKFFGKP